MEKNFYKQAVDSDIKRYKQIRKLTTTQGKGYTTGYLLVFEYIWNHHRLITVDLSRQKELDADPKEIQQLEFVGQLKKLNADVNPESVCLDNFSTNQRNQIKIFSRKCNCIITDSKLSRSES